MNPRSLGSISVFNVNAVWKRKLLPECFTITRVETYCVASFVAKHIQVDYASGRHSSVREIECSTGALTVGHEGEVVGPPYAQRAPRSLRTKIEVKRRAQNVGETCITSSVQVQVARVEVHPRLSQCESRHSMHAHAKTD